MEKRAFSMTCEVQQQQPGKHRGESDEADLPVAHLGQAAERFAPQAGHQERQYALDDEHQRERG